MSTQEFCEAFPQLFGAADATADGPTPPYRMRGIIGRGAHGKCLKMVSNEADGHALCLKVTGGLASQHDYTVARQAFERELFLTNRVRSFFSVHIYRMYEGLRTEQAADASAPVVNKLYLGLAMDVFSGKSVAEDIRARVMGGHGPYTELQAGFLFVQVAMAAAEAHRNNVMHRDIKPANILMRPSGLVCLADFGLASSNDTSTTMCGTPYYMAPEIWMHQPYNNKVDVWSLGVYLYELLCFDRPFRCPPDFTGGSTQEGVGHAVLNLQPDFSPQVFKSSAEMVMLIQWMLIKDPDHRPSIDDVLAHPTIKSIIVLLMRSVHHHETMDPTHRHEALRTCTMWVGSESPLASHGLSNSLVGFPHAGHQPQTVFRTAVSYTINDWSRSETCVDRDPEGQWILSITPVDGSGTPTGPADARDVQEVSAVFSTEYSPLSSDHTSIVIVVFKDFSYIRLQLKVDEKDHFMDRITSRRLIATQA